MKLPDLLDGLEFEKRLKSREAIAEAPGDTMAKAMYGIIEQEPVSVEEDRAISKAINSRGL
jgi:hypothetical protein